MFEARGISSGYTGVTVIKNVDLNVEHEVFAVLGANGAGKTTLLATLARLIPLMSGELWFDGEDISKAHPWDTAAAGLGYVPQEEGVFADLTVLENLLLPLELAGRLDLELWARFSAGQLAQGAAVWSGADLRIQPDAGGGVDVA